MAPGEQAKVSFSRNYFRTNSVLQISSKTSPLHELQELDARLMVTGRVAPENTKK